MDGDIYSKRSNKSKFVLCRHFGTFRVFSKPERASCELAPSRLITSPPMMRISKRNPSPWMIAKSVLLAAA